MRRTTSAAVALALALGTAPAAAAAAHHDLRPGAAGTGDPYFPLDGNGGYDVAHYRLDLRYDPPSDRLDGVATMWARATHGLSRFNLDLDGLTVRSVTVDGAPARWQRGDGELVVTPAGGVQAGQAFTTEVRYDGVPQPLEDGLGGFLHTDDGTLVAGEPHVASVWFPVNDHPSDKASYAFRLTVPDPLVAVANGVLVGRSPQAGWTTWTWRQDEPMASYLATATIGEFDLRSYEQDGVRYWDAVDPDLKDPVATPRTGRRFAYSQVSPAGGPSYERLSRTVAVPADGGRLSFAVDRDTEPGWDFFLVEARTPGRDDWTTLRDLNGHTTQEPGFDCPSWFEQHPFLRHYQTDAGGEPCRPEGTTGEWWAATGRSDGWEDWEVDLSPWAGGTVELSLTVVTDVVIELPGAFVDDIVSPGGGSTSFERDGDVLDGWRPAGGPTPGVDDRDGWTVITQAGVPDAVGVVAESVLDRQPEMIAWLSRALGPYPFAAGGGIVDDVEGLGFALENQSRPIYAPEWFVDRVSAEEVVVHELAHQWLGDSLTVHRWRHIWLNEGFATYAEWLWDEREGYASVEGIVEDLASIPPGDPFWDLRIGDPGPDALFAAPVYYRGALTLHFLREELGDAVFWRAVGSWARRYEGGTVTQREFEEHVERFAGRDLHAFFREWLFTPGRPRVLDERAAAGARAVVGPAPDVSRLLDPRRLPHRQG